MHELETRVLSAARAAALFQVEQIVKAVIAAMQKMDASGLFCEILARHAWDEYCWQLQEGPFDDDDIGFGSTSKNFGVILETFIDAEIEKIPAPIKQLLVAYICEEGQLCDGCGVCDCSLEDVKEFLLEQVNEIASRRSLGLIGPDRAQLISYEHALGGLVGEAFTESGEHSELLSLHADDLMMSASLAHKQVSAELLDHYMGLLNVAAEDSEALTGLLSRFDAEIRDMVMEKELWPHVEELAGQLQESLDEL